jgi:hypothetical protein
MVPEAWFGHNRELQAFKGWGFLAGADREAYYQEAIALGGAVEALLGFVEGACKRGTPSAAVYVAARRQACLLPSHMIYL